MYFDSIPNIEYLVKPSKYPFTQGDFVKAKNFFKRYQINEDVFSYAVFFKKYTIKDYDRLDLIAKKYYDDPFYDWVIVLTNNMINSAYDWPLTREEFNQKLSDMKTDPYSTVHHYETLTVGAGYKMEGLDVIALQGGLTVSEEFYNGTYTYYNGTASQTVLGNQISRPVYVAEYEEKLNESKREIFILKKQYLESFVKDFKRQNSYKKSTDYISSKLKTTSF
jgi:hypothetical protein